MPARRFACWCCLLFLPFAVCHLATAASARIINGTPTDDFPTVGIVGSFEFGGFCSGTLVEPNKVVTAGHCADGELAEELFFQLGDEVYGVAAVYVHPGYDAETLEDDVAVLILDEAVPDIAPSPLYRQVPRRGQLLTLVGYGAGGTGDTGELGDFGTKRVGTTPIDRVTKKQLLWTFHSNSESNTAPGDSGGPAFLQVEGTYFVAGITSGGSEADASLGDHSFDTRVDAFASWIDEPHNRSPIRIYQLREKGLVSDALALAKLRGRGYLVVDYAAHQAITITTRKVGAASLVVRQDWHDFGPLAQTVIFDGQRVHSTLALQQVAPGAGAWLVLSGKGRGHLGGRLVFNTAKGETLLLADGTLTRAAVTLRLATALTAALTDELSADDVADAIAGDLLSASSAAAPAPADLPSPAVQIFRLAGKEVQEGFFGSDRYKLSGYLLFDLGQQQATLLLVTGNRFGSSLEVVSLDDDWTLALLAQLGGEDGQWVLLAGHPTLYTFTRCLFTGAVRDGVAKRLAGTILLVEDEEIAGADMRATYTLRARRDPLLIATYAGLPLGTVASALESSSHGASGVARPLPTPNRRAP